MCFANANVHVYELVYLQLSDDGFGDDDDDFGDFGGFEVRSFLQKYMKRPRIRGTANRLFLILKYL